MAKSVGGGISINQSGVRLIIEVAWRSGNDIVIINNENASEQCIVMTYSLPSNRSEFVDS